MKRQSLLQVLLLTLCLLPDAQAIDIGNPAPNCKLTDFKNSQNQSLDSHRGKVLLVDFWASWCGPCAKSFPFFNQLHNQLGDKGLEIIGINLDEEPAEAAAFLSHTPAQFNLQKDDENQTCAKAFEVKAMPSTYVIDRAGVLRHVQLGFHEGETDTLRQLLERLLTEK